MYCGFNLSLQHGDLENYDECGRQSYKIQKHRIESSIETFMDSDEIIIASQLVANWFPQIDCEVFISHAHKDREFAIRLAGFLKSEFGITSFINSCAWGYSDSLLRILDNRYCRQEWSQTYDYSKRNKSTTHVHMMLSTALIKMIDQCECVIFLNTPQSISSSSYINGYTTESPWIYAELVMTALIQRRAPEGHRRAKRSAIATEGMRIKYACRSAAPDVHWCERIEDLAKKGAGLKISRRTRYPL